MNTFLRIFAVLALIALFSSASPVLAYQTGSSSPQGIPININVGGVEHVKQWIIAGIDWLATVVVWFWRGLSTIIVVVTTFIAKIILFIVEGVVRLFETIFRLLKQ